MPFATHHKSDPRYLDLAANAHGAEKAMMMYRAVQRCPEGPLRMVEIGPGGGAAVAHLADRLAEEAPRDTVELTLIEAPGVESETLAHAMETFGRVGTCRLKHGHAQDLCDLILEPAHVVSASALLHELYSYGGGYGGIHMMMRNLPRALAPGGFFAYRDVYAVDAPSLHERAVQVYEHRSWLQFIRMFVPGYLAEGTHPYHHASDDVVVRQDSRIVPADGLDPRKSAIVSAPIGVIREIQRHYITARDHVWRRGALGFVPALEGQLAGDWIDAPSGHKRVHYRLSEHGSLTRQHYAMLLAVSEPYGDHFTVDGDIFDDCTDAALTEFLTLAEQGGEQAQVWQEWSAREGRETYAYMTVDELVADMAVKSADQGADAVILPRDADDVVREPRRYYNRYLRKRLSAPLTDAKQLVLFSRVELADAVGLTEAMGALRKVCSKKSIARVHSVISDRI